MTRFIAVWLLLVNLWWLPANAESSTPSAETWLALRQGTAIAIMRHALAPGIGDPASFAPGKCSTQRNLSETGIAQAQGIGQTLRHVGIDAAQVYSSSWCRCIDTAEQLKLGPVTKLPALDSFFQDRSTATSQTDELKTWINSRLAGKPGAPVILVTHQVNISALTGRGTSSGEMLFITIDDGEIRVIDSLLNTP